MKAPTRWGLEKVISRQPGIAYFVEEDLQDKWRDYVLCAFDLIQKIFKHQYGWWLWKFTA